VASTSRDHRRGNSTRSACTKEWVMAGTVADQIVERLAGAGAHVAREPVVCAASCRAGNPDLAIGLTDRHRSRVAALATAALIPSAEIGANWRQGS
jgi:hypothetical protein